MFRIGIDVGGTFTDLVSVDAQGRVALAKAASTPADQSLGVMDGLDRLAETLGIDRATMLARTERIVHGTTVATNALLEHKGAKVGLLTTEGHRDVVEMREGLKDDRYNLRMPPPEQLVPRRLRLPVRERMRADGRIDTPLDPASLEAAIAVLQRERVESVAVCYLHAWCDPRHERQTAEALARALPDAYVSLSSAVLPQIKEFERVSTTIVNAYVGPVLSRYLARLESRLAEAGYRGPTLIIQSHGGVAPIAEAGRLAAGAVLSGPAGGAATKTWPRALSIASPRRSASIGSARRTASIASSTRIWPRECASFRSGVALIRGVSPCLRLAAPPDCTRPISRASSASCESSCRASPRCCPPGGCSRPICVSNCRARISATPRCSTAPRSSTCSTRWKQKASRDCAPRSPGRPALRDQWTCAMASRFSRSRCRSTTSIGTLPIRCRRLSSVSIDATRRSTPIRCRIRKRCLSTRGLPCPASSRNCRRNRTCPPDRRHLRRRSAASISTIGLRRRSMPLTGSPRRR